MTTPETGADPISPTQPTSEAGSGEMPAPAEGEAEVAQAEDDAAIGATVAALTADDLEPAGRRELLGRLVADVRRRGVAQLYRPAAALRWITDAVSDIAPHVPVRDLDTLHEHFPDLDDDDLADRLIRNASRATAGIGAVGGGVATLEWVATPTLLSVPVLLAAETVAVVAVELKLIGELHEVYGQPIKGNTAERATALLHAWSGQRGVNPMLPGVGIASILGTASRRELQNTLLRRFGRNLTALGPFLTGAAVASYLNRRATRNLGEKVQKDLRKKRPEISSEQSEDQ
jgi:hypothetical protein